MHRWETNLHGCWLSYLASTHYTGGHGGSGTSVVPRYLISYIFHTGCAWVALFLHLFGMFGLPHAFLPACHLMFHQVSPC